MKRDMDLIRKLVLCVEDKPDGWASAHVAIDGYTAEQIGYHAYLLVDAGLAAGVDRTHMGSSGPEYLLTHLTWAGHDFADAIRNDSIWKRARDLIKDRAETVSFDVMKALLASLLKTAVGLP